eukprot:497773_1
MALSTAVIQSHEIVKEGWFQKKSDVLREWRQRWFVLTASHLYSFKENQYTDPTEVFELSKIKQPINMPSKEEEHIVCLRTDRYFYTYVKFSSGLEMHEWVDLITGYINAIQIPVVVECEGNNEYSYACNFKMPVPIVPSHKKYKYEISAIINDIVQYVERKSHGIKFCVTKIDRKSFIAKELHDDCSFAHFHASILEYDKQDIITKGLHVSIVVDNRCQHMLNDSPCPIYVEMRDNEVYSEANFHHLLEYKHFKNEFMQKPECKQGEDCDSYKRVLDGGNELDDLCHFKLYRHYHINPLHPTLTESTQEDITRNLQRNMEILSEISDTLRAIDIKKWANARASAAKEIRTLAQMLEKTIFDVGIARTTSGGASIVGGGLALAGVILIPFTAGVSLALTIAGGSTMLASGVTTLSSSLIKHFTENDFTKRCIEAYEGTQPDARRMALLLNDYSVTFTLTRRNVFALQSISYKFAGKTVWGAGVNTNGVYQLVKQSIHMNKLNGLSLAGKVAAAADTAGDVVNVVKAPAQIATVTATQTATELAEVAALGSGSFLAKAFGWASGPLGIAAGIYDIVKGIETMNDAKNAVHKLRLLANDISNHTEKIKEVFDKLK